jgi:hypothetical protein
MADLESYKTSVAAIARDSKDETGAFIARLKTLSAEEFLRLPRRDVERLSIAQYIDVARAIAPNIPPLITVREAEPELRKRSFNWTPGRLHAAVIVVSIGLGLAWSMTGSMLTGLVFDEALIRSRTVLDWPACRRLTADVDGCVYRPAQDLSWDYVAAMLEMDRDTLHRNNAHLTEDVVPRASQLVVWRYHGLLEN